jgi:DNA-binding NarL/FixJ family response regulator
MKKIKIALADDHTLVRQSIALALETNEQFVVTCQAGNGKILLDQIKKDRPDVIILDLEMPVMSGWETMPHLKKNYPSCKVVVLSMHFDGLYIKDLVNRGAQGFLPKNSDFETLLNAIHEVHDLGYFFSKKISPAIIKELWMSQAIAPYFNDTPLSDKELETLRYICKDKNSKEIAKLLDVSERTVERYFSALFEKTKAKTTAGLVLYAIKKNLMTL